MVHLSGRVEIIVIEARGLPNLDGSILNKNDKSDPYCVVTAEGINGSRRIGKTFTIDDCLNPKWNFKMGADLNQDVSGLKFVVKDKDVFKSEVIGSCFLDSMIFSNSSKPYTAMLHLTSPKGRPAGAVRIQVMFTGSNISDSTAESSSMMEKVKIKKDDMKTRMAYSSKIISKRGDVKAVILHGALEIHISQAINLPNLDTSVFSFKNTDVSDPYIDVVVEDIFKESWKVATSSVIENNLNPVWNENFYVNVCHDIVAIKFIVKDKDVLSADTIGTVTIRAEDLLHAREINGNFDIYVKEKPRKNCKLNLSISFKSQKELSSSPDVPQCFYPPREMNNVKLYQDAHCVGLPPIVANHGKLFRQSRAWLDLYNAIMGSKEYIYIVGWSVNARIPLLRWTNEDNRCIGDILVQKANEGVRVLVMVWDELTSTELNKEGAMGTSDEATAEFFRDTNVVIVLAARDRKTKDISTKQRFTNFCYTHHQKCIVIDAEVKGDPKKRQPIAFLGGLDLTNGRFDTPEHPLFNTLDTDHREDFYNSLCNTKVNYGPREPWHDVHCRIEGQVVQDLISNFVERWNKQGNKNISLVHSEMKRKVQMRSPDRWNAQVFRSINSDSAVFSASPKLNGLFVKKERVYDNSIQRAYIHHIRRSKGFLYMENQYFMGSSHEWLDSRDAHIENLVPLEIAAHIEDKIKMRERFVAYILIPMFPEGKPADKVTQEMLHWQYRTIEMMYYRVANAIADSGVDAHPQDYLLFLCVGKRERSEAAPRSPTELTGHAANAFLNRRLMIYVHSKMAIFDDEYVILGSANINDRSLNGNRDTEIAIGAYQVEHMKSGTTYPDGEVSIFRKSLWIEHMGQEAPLDVDPSSLDCVRRVKHLAEEGFLSFIDQNNVNGTVRHLLLYPLDVHEDGTVTERDDCPTFPDTTAKVTGKRSGYIPTPLTS